MKRGLEVSHKLALIMIVILALGMQGCSDSGLLPVGSAVKGQTLILTLEDISRTPEIRYKGIDNNSYLVSPSYPEENEFVVLKLEVHNADATLVILAMDEDSAELRGFELDQRFPVVDVTTQNIENVTIQNESHPTENQFIPFIAGTIDVPTGAFGYWMGCF